MGSNYKLKENDVLSKHRRSRECRLPHHLGNQRFRTIVDARAERYRNARNRVEKTEIVKEVVAIARQGGGDFVRQDENGCWYAIGNIKAREKAGNAMRAATSRFSLREKKREKDDTPSKAKLLDGMITPIAPCGMDTTTKLCNRRPAPISTPTVSTGTSSSAANADIVITPEINVSGTSANIATTAVSQKNDRRRV